MKREQCENIHNDLIEEDFTGGCAEVDAVCSQANELEGTPNSTKLLGLVAWCPALHGARIMELYCAKLFELPSLVKLSATFKSRSPESKLGAIKSFRYLVQDSPPGFLLGTKFIEGLKWIGEQGISFDLTVDTTKVGIGSKVLEEVVECITKCREGQSNESLQTWFILDHFSKPDLKTEPTIPPSEDYTTYIRALFSLALLPNVYIKLSALLDSISTDPNLVQAAFLEHCNNSTNPNPNYNPDYTDSILSPNLANLESRILQYLEPALESFGDSRIIIGGDWPMYRKQTVKFGSVVDVVEKLDERVIEREARAWEFQFQLYRRCLVRIGVEGEGLDRIFSDNAKVFYRL